MGIKTRFTFILLLLSCLLVTSCGSKKNKKTSTKVVLGNVVSGNLALVSGGIMIFGAHRQSPKKFAMKYTGQVLDLPNGDWDFAALAWAGQAFQGTQRCALATAQLKGNDVEVPLELDPAVCTDNFFGSQETKDASGVPLPLSFATCGNGSCLFGNGDNSQVSVKGVAKSYQIMLPGFTDGPGGATEGLGVISNCFTPAGNTTDPLSTSTIKFPIVAFPIPTVIRAYDNGACQGGYDQFDLFNGIKSPIPEVTWFQNLPGSTNIIRLKSQLCRSEASVGGSQYRKSTSGTSGNIEQHIICNADQMDNMVAQMATVANQEDIYILGQDIDYTSVTPSGTIGDNTNNFRGIFDGQGYEVRNFTYAQPGGTLGIFGNINGISNAQKAKIQNTMFRSINIDMTGTAQQDIGAVIGVIQDYSEVKNIHLFDSTVTLSACGGGCNHVGGIAGRINPTNESEIFNVSSNNTMLDIRGTNQTGGIVGKIMNNGALRYSVVNGVRAQTNGGANNNIGGAVGDNDGEVFDVIVNNLDFNEDNFTLTPGNSVGGVVGSTSANSRIFNVKASGNIKLSNTDHVGGIVGWIPLASLDGVVDAISNVTINVTGTPATDGQNIGGIVGNFDATSGNIELKNVRNYGTITCVDRCGGIVGHLRDINGTSEARIQEAHNYANVTGTSNEIGGIIGRLDSPSLAGAATRRKMHNTGNITANNKAGGIVGRRIGTIAGHSKFNNAYNTGDITATTSFAGGIVGDSGSVDVSDIDHVYSTGSITSPGTKSATMTNFTDLGYTGNCFYDSADQNDGTAGGCVDVNAGPNSIANYTAISAEFIDDPAGGSPVLDKWNTIETLGASFLGSKNDPFQISTTTQWNAIGDMQGLMGRSFILTADLDFQNGSVAFTPIGSTTFPFTGEFQGNNRTIYDVTLNESSATQPIGIFRKIGAKARFEHGDNDNRYSLNLRNIQFTTDWATSNGILAGELQDGASEVRISHVNVIGGFIDAPSINTGGVIGKMDLFNDNSSFRNITSSATIENCTGQNSGGLFGNIQDQGITNSRFDVLTFNGTFNDTNCDNTGHNGGIVGHANSLDIKIENAINYANVFGDYAGGIMGKGDAKIFASANFGTINGNNSAGGIVGEMNNGSSEIEACYNHGNVLDSTYSGSIIGTAAAATVVVNNNYSYALRVEGTNTDYFTGDSTNMSFLNNLYFSDGAEVPTGATKKTRGQVFDLFQTDAITNGLANSPWVRFPGQYPVFHYQAFPEFFD